MDVRTRIKRAVNELLIPTPEFRIEVGWGHDYDQLFEGNLSPPTDVFALVRTALAKGYVLLSGRGGGAKTVTVYRLAQYALRNDVVPIVVSLKNWTGRDYDIWQAADSQSVKLDFLLSRFGLVPLRALDIDEIALDLIRLVLLDGLNEVNSRTGQEVIYTLEEYIRFAPSSRIIVTDRLVRRSFVSPDRWQLAVVHPLSPGEIRKQIHSRFGSKRFTDLSSDTTELLSSPYFLNAFLTDGRIATTKSEEFKTYFLEHALTNDDLDLAARGAFEAYKCSSVTFQLTEFARNSSDEVVHRLKESGALRVKDDSGYFDHHLKHDYLAARYLAHHDVWNDQTFKYVSFDASSFETIMLTLEQIDTADRADRFLRQVYDWNIYGAGYAIAEARKTAANREMQIVILAMLAERRFDIMRRTVERATDTLNLIKTPDAVRFQTARVLQDIFLVLNDVNSTQRWFREWRTMYTREPGTRATDDDVNCLGDPDSITGWTSSNVLKRLILTDAQQGMIRRLLQGGNDAVVRWRAAHVLGAFPNRVNAEVLLIALSDEAVSVRFGSTRSLVEIAARDPNMTDDVFRGLIAHVADIAEHRSVVEEVQRAVFIVPEKAPPRWTAAVFPLINVLEAKSTSAYKAEQWDRVLKELVTIYGM